jgi:hypothetical protein
VCKTSDFFRIAKKQTRKQAHGLALKYSVGKVQEAGVAEMDQKISKLQSFNSWGMVTVTNEQITVIMSALTPDGKPITRTVRKDSEHPLGFTGSALVAVDLAGKAQGVHEVGETAIMGHPDVEKVFQSTLEWLRRTAK